jgi:peptide/nickel transport system substrate-binding protein
MSPRLLSLAAAIAVALMTVSPAAPRGVKEGGTFRIAVPAGFVDTIDPALADFPAEGNFLGPACGSLMDYPSKPLPEGGRLRPELAEADPVVSRDGRTYTLTVRKDARFSDGSRVTARAFMRAIERVLDPAMKGFGAGDLAAALVGGEDVLAGKTKTPSGVSARGRVLTLKLTRRIPDFLGVVEQLCAVPPNLPADPEGAKPPLPSAAPYYVKEYVPGERLLLERNRFYKGERPHHVDRFVADLAVNENTIIDEIASGKLDYGWAVGTLRTRGAELKQRYGVNKSQFWVQPQPFLRMFMLNTSRPLFKNNPKLRQAINFAVDRKALLRELGPSPGTATDQYLLPAQPGYTDERIYPLKAPDLRRARALAKGHTRGGMAVLYTLSNPFDTAQARVLQQNLKAIGIEVEIVQFPTPTLLFEKLATGAKDFDIGRIALGHSRDPSWFAGIFDGRTIGKPGSFNYAYFNSPKYNRLFDEAARLNGDERYRAYGELDVQLSREAAPAVPIGNLNATTFVSARTGCVVVNPFLDLTAVCLK